MKNNPSVIKLEDVIGSNVKNHVDEDLGHVETLILDKVSGCVSYVVLSVGGFLGVGDKLFALPWDIFRYDVSQDCYVINVDKKKLENSPGFDKDNWPDITSTQWSQTIHTYYGTEPRKLAPQPEPNQK